MVTSIERLIADRKFLLEGLRRNDGFQEGLQRLLTDLYPDTAHFIYELLQNAEDMDATVARFILNSDGVYFEHNGTKRDFNLDDINAITNICYNQQKKDDPTSIGKFGIGFKAVYAYTDTPEIHSGEYHFKITDRFLPETEGVEKLNTVDADGVPWTKFLLPFNNSQKTSDIAFEEVFHGLSMLNDSAILFLRNIKRIEYTCTNGQSGYIERLETQEHHVKIVCKKSEQNNLAQSHWLRFVRPVHITDEQGNPKNLAIAIAYALESDTKTHKLRIVPVKGGGKTFIYFPAEKEHSGLRFHINAPFASTVARDSVRDCKDNFQLIKAVAQLVSDSVETIKSLGMLGHPLFEVLPNSKDELSPFYGTVFDFLYSAFHNYAYLPTKDNHYVTATAALMGPAGISNVLKNADIQKLIGVNKKWIVNAPQRNSHADCFLQSLDIEIFSYDNFAALFNDSAREVTEKVLQEQTSDWLKHFDALCADAYENMRYNVARNFICDLMSSRIIRSAEGKMYRPSDIYILPVNTPLITKTTPIVEQNFVVSQSKTDRLPSKIKRFFQEELSIQEYGPHTEIETLLKKYQGDFAVDDEHFRDMLSFAKYNMEHDDIDFTSQRIFLYQGNDHTLHNAQAGCLYLGQAYGNNCGELLASAYDKQCLWDGYASQYNENELLNFIRFAEQCNIQKELSILKCSAFSHPLFYSKLHTSAKTTYLRIDSDYTIPELHKLLTMHSTEISKLIWHALEQYGKKNGEKYTTARYAPNGSEPVRKCDSSLIYLLKENAWLPDRKNRLHKPADIAVGALRKDFIYDDNNQIMAALGIGTEVEKKTSEIKHIKEKIEKMGYTMIPTDDYPGYLEYKALKSARPTPTPLSSQELLSQQTKTSAANISRTASAFPNGSIKDKKQHEANIETTFKNAKQMRPSERQLFSRVTDATKQERAQLRAWYDGVCQICGTTIVGFNRVPHFVAKNIINTQYLSESVRKTTGIAWNSLCLCPNCATKYDVCSRDINGLYEQIIGHEIIESDATPIILTIELDNKTQEIHYIPQHFLALKTMMKLIDAEINKE